MAGYRYYKLLNQNTVITANGSSPLINVPPSTLLVYSLFISAFSGALPSMTVSLSMVSTAGTVIEIGRAPTRNSVGLLAMYVTALFDSVMVSYFVSGTTPSFTVTDELEVVG